MRQGSRGGKRTMNESILIVEDDPDVRQVLARSLSARFRVKTAPDGRAALDLLWREQVDGVVTDLRMPGMNGKELVFACARSFPGTPVLVVTASGELETAVQTMKAGAWDYAVKPVRGDVLIAKMEEALERARSSFDISLAVAETMAGRSPKLSGARFGPYTLKEAIALGSYALVVKAEDESGDEIAIKFLRPGVEREPEALERFRREAAITKEIRHPNIVSTYEFGQISGTHFIAMEYVDGPALIDLIEERGVLDEGLVLGVCRQMAKALLELERCGIVHRDIKPDNVLLGKDGVAKLADLGIAALRWGSRRLTQHGWTVGTLEYMSPEQIDASTVDIRADIFALGATMYHALCGRPPFEDPDERVLIGKRLAMEAPLVSMVRRDLRRETVRLVARMMHMRKEERFRGPNELLRASEGALRAVSGGETRTRG